MTHLVLDATNAAKATFNISPYERIEPVSIINNLFILPTDLEELILSYDPTITFEKRELTAEEQTDDLL